MNTKRRTRWPLLALAAGLSMICCSEAHVGCSPSLTCSLRPARFVPPPVVDAGPQPCDLTLARCSAMQISAGGQHTCAVTSADNVLCWGDNSQRQRGDTLDDPAMAHATSTSDGVGPDAGVYVSRVSRVLDGARQVAAGGAHTCALLLDGTVRCWGRDVEGQVDGRNDHGMVEAPTDPGVSAAVQISAGALHSCALVSAGVMCWGNDRYGQAGQTPTDDPQIPTLVAGTASTVEVACGARHSCARLNNRTVVCWGELIDGSGAPYVTELATPVSGIDDAIEISAGGGHSCALTANQAVVCWGHNDSGQLGDGTTQASATPVAVMGLETRARHVAAGGGELNGQLVGHTCAVDGEFHVACWGRGSEGQLGDGLSTDHATGMLVLLARVDSADSPALDNVERVALGAFHSCALDSEHAVLCWGDDSAEQLGDAIGLGFGGGMQDQNLPGRATRVRRFGAMR